MEGDVDANVSLMREICEGSGASGVLSINL